MKRQRYEEFGRPGQDSKRQQAIVGGTVGGVGMRRGLIGDVVDAFKAVGKDVAAEYEYEIYKASHPIGPDKQFFQKVDAEFPLIKQTAEAVASNLLDQPITSFQEGSRGGASAGPRKSESIADPPDTLTPEEVTMWRDMYPDFADTYQDWGQQEIKDWRKEVAGMVHAPPASSTAPPANANAPGANPNPAQTGAGTAAQDPPKPVPPPARGPTPTGPPPKEPISTRPPTQVPTPTPTVSTPTPTRGTAPPPLTQEQKDAWARQFGSTEPPTDPGLLDRILARLGIGAAAASAGDGSGGDGGDGGDGDGGDGGDGDGGDGDGGDGGGVGGAAAGILDFFKTYMGWNKQGGLDAFGRPVQQDDDIQTSKDRVTALRPFFPVGGEDDILEQGTVEADRLKQENLQIGMVRPANWPLHGLDNPIYVQNMVHEYDIRYAQPMFAAPARYSGGNMDEDQTLYGSYPMA